MKDDLFPDQVEDNTPRQWEIVGTCIKDHTDGTGDWTKGEVFDHEVFAKNEKEALRLLLMADSELIKKNWSFVVTRIPA